MENANVYIKVCKIEENTLLEVLKEVELTATKEFENDDSVGYVLHDIKWYYTHPDMQKIVKFIENKKGCLRGLIAFGENGEVIKHGSPSAIGMSFDYNLLWS